jgi:hypothetical protein
MLRYISPVPPTHWARHVDRRVWIVLGILLLILVLSAVIL